MRSIVIVSKFHLCRKPQIKCPIFELRPIDPYPDPPGIDNWTTRLWEFVAGRKIFPARSWFELERNSQNTEVPWSSGCCVWFCSNSIWIHKYMHIKKRFGQDDSVILSLAGDVVIGGSSDGKWARVLACCLDSRKVSFSWPSAFKVSPPSAKSTLFAWVCCLSFFLSSDGRNAQVVAKLGTTSHRHCQDKFWYQAPALKFNFLGSWS